MIAFSDGLVFDPDEVLTTNSKIFEGVFPHQWTKIKISLKLDFDMTKLINSIAKKSSGRIGFRTSRCFNKHVEDLKMVLAFENEDDVLMFKIRGVDWYNNAD